MGALTLEQYEDPAIFNVDRWVDFRQTPSGMNEAVFLDPANGNPYSANGEEAQEPPEWLVNDDRFSGLLGRTSLQHNLTIAFGRHQFASDLDYESGGSRWFEKQLLTADVYCYEAVRWRRNTMGRALANLDVLTSLSGFDRRVLMAIAATEEPGKPRIPTFSDDIEETDRPLDKLLIELDSLEDPEEEQSERIAGLSDVQKAVLHAALPYMRDWYIPGKYADEVQRLDGTPSRVFKTMGDYHEAIVSRFHLFDIVPEVVNLDSTIEPNDSGKQKLVRFSKTGRFLLGD